MIPSFELFNAQGGLETPNLAPARGGAYVV